jgi:hypothetical protein
MCVFRLLFLDVVVNWKYRKGEASQTKFPLNFKPFLEQQWYLIGTIKLIKQQKTLTISNEGFWKFV